MQSSTRSREFESELKRQCERIDMRSRSRCSCKEVFGGCRQGRLGKLWRVHAHSNLHRYCLSSVPCQWRSMAAGALHRGQSSSRQRRWRSRRRVLATFSDRRNNWISAALLLCVHHYKARQGRLVLRHRCPGCVHLRPANLKSLSSSDRALRLSRMSERVLT